MITRTKNTSIRPTMRRLHDQRSEATADARKAIASLSHRATELGLTITAKESRATGAEGKSMHVQFHRDRWLVADYWPTTGRLRIGGNNRRAKTLADAFRIVRVAVGG
jgi:hypothetical protein